MDYKETLMYKEILQQEKVIKNLRPILSDTIKQITKNLNIEFISIAARGSSLHTGYYFKYLCEIFVGIPVHISMPSTYTVYGGKMDLSKGLVIGISQSGKAQDAIEVLAGAKKQGAKTVAITNTLSSPMASVADYHLFINAGEEKSVAATKTLTAQMQTLLLLAEALSKKDLYSKKVPKLIAQVRKTDAELSALAKNFITLNNAIVLGRGLNYSAALECALKMQETSYINARGYASSDFQHGPIAVLDNNSTVFLLLDSGKTNSDICAIKDKCERTGAKTVALKVIDAPDTVLPFLHICCFQLFVNALSVAKGLNPDAPRGLNKVTITL